MYFISKFTLKLIIGLARFMPGWFRENLMPWNWFKQSQRKALTLLESEFYERFLRNGKGKGREK